MQDLAMLRAEIEKLDAQIIENIALRSQKSIEIGKLKEILKMDIEDLVREKQLHDYHSKLAQQYGLSENLVHDLFEEIFKYSKQVQR